MKHRLGALIASGLLATSLVAAPMTALADTLPSGQTGRGSSSLYMVLENNNEYGGTDTRENPDEDGDGLGDNIAFSVPVAINFVAKANGELIGPDASATYIQNHSAFPIHVSSMDVDEQVGWHIVEDVTAADNASTTNAVDFTFGPVNDQLSAVDYLEKDEVSSPEEWNMTLKGDKVELTTSGHIANITEDITRAKQFATICTYVKAGIAE
jgi:hypothetical protein